MIGQKIAHYEIVSLLGKGGMGEVYRARDPHLDRDVAIKILPPELGENEERAARFEREARTLAGLNHPNIAGLYGVEFSGGHRYLIMELAEGVDLSVRIGQGPLPLEEALDIAEQIARGLEEAHEKGVVHRDLKPANIQLSADGVVKLLDFGLARAFQGGGVDESNPMHSPTITAAMTQQGTIMGTAAYMSPEQAKGKTVDRRADVWSYGVVLWEMLSGKRLFDAETTSEVLADVLRAELPWDDLPESTPAGVRQLLERCLERDPRERLRDIGEARIRLRRWTADPSSMHHSLSGALEVAHERRRSAWVPWSLAAVAALVGLWGWMGRTSMPEISPAMSYELSLNLLDDRGRSTRDGVGGRVGLSPDGRILSYFSGPRIHLRHLDGSGEISIRGSEQARSYCFSPDSQWLAFAAAGIVYRTSVHGGSPIPVGEVDDPRGIAWVDESTLVVSPNFEQPLFKMSIETGERVQLTELDHDREERTHRWPMWIPGTRKVLASIQFTGRPYQDGEILMVDVDTGERTTVHRGGCYARYSPSGHLIFVRDSSLFAIAFDPETGQTSGRASRVLEGVESSLMDQENDNGSSNYSISDDGALVYRTMGQSVAETRLAWIDHETADVFHMSSAGMHTSGWPSPDGRWIALVRSIGNGGHSEIRLVDRERRVETALVGANATNRSGTFSPDGKTLYWARSDGDDLWWLVRQAVNGSTTVDSLTSTSNSLLVDSISPDGRYLLASNWNRSQGWDLLGFDLLDQDAEFEPWQASPGNQLRGKFSPDGRWVLFLGGPFGDANFYLRRYPDTGAEWKVTRESRNWGQATWAPDSKSVLIANLTGVNRYIIDEVDGFVSIGDPQSVLSEVILERAGVRTDLMPDTDGSGSFFFDPVGENAAYESEVILITDWTDRISEN